MDDDIQINGGSSLGEDFYETIEAPKFVDLTKPDRYRPDNDDRYWFCLRVGCDRKHEEEMDSEAIYENFVLRVMAARSPNIRLRKALYGKDPSRNVKCPLTVPAKSSKSRISRLALVSSSISQKMVDGNVKGRPLFKQCETPKNKKKQSSVAAKALTTPRNKKRLSNLGTFRSVRNPKPTTVAVPKNRMVAKALVFHSPKKTVGMNLKRSVELRSSVRKLCAGMKKLEITGGKNNISGCDKQLPGDASRKRLRGREVKSRLYDSLHSQNCKGKDAKSLRCLKKKNEEKELQLCRGPVPCEEAENDSSDMEIEEKSRNGSLEACSMSDTLKSSQINEHEDGSETQKTSEFPLVQNKGEAMLDTSGSEGTSPVKCKEKNIGEKDVACFQDQNGEYNRTNEESASEEQVKSSPEKGIMLNIIETDENEDASVSDNKENESEVINCDDKENASASNDNRNVNPNTSDMGKKKILSKHEASKSTMKVSKGVNKMSKGNSTSAVTCGAGVNYKKPKLTNPKPFRLRTDERQILKEANLEKKLHLNEPIQETATKRIRQHAVQRNEECLEQADSASDAHEGSERESARRIRKDQPQRRGTSCPHTSKAAGERKESTTLQRNTISLHQKRHLTPARQESSKGREAKKSEKTFKRTKSLCLIQLETTPGVEPGKKKTFCPTTPGQLGVIKELLPTILRTKVVTKPTENGAPLATKTSASSAIRPSLLGRKPSTVPKEPHFHNVHVPKRCTKRVAA